MDKKRLTLDLIKNEIASFKRLREKSSSSSSNSSVEEGAATILVDKLINILENAEREDAEVPTPEQKALSNSVVVREILSYLNARTLLKFREVSRLWKEEATSFLLSPRHEESLCVKFSWLEDASEFSHDSEFLLSDFMERCLQNSGIFPCSQFIFTGGQLSDPVLTRFFTDYGSLIQHLDLSPKSMDLKPLRQILFKWAPNVKSLVLGSRNWPEQESLFELDPDEKEPIIRLLPKLSKIKLPEIHLDDMQREGQPIYEILTSAPNLTCIEDLYLAYVVQIISAGKMPLVNSLQWNFSQNRRVDRNFFRFIEAGPQVNLTSIFFEDTYNQLNEVFFPAVHTLMQLAQNTLENFRGIQHLGYINYLQKAKSLKFPPLPKVTQLTLTVRQCMNYRGYDTPLYRILPKDHLFSEFLPNLKSLCVENKEQLRDFTFTAPENGHPGVENLKVSNFVSEVSEQSRFRFNPEWLSVLGGLYPNVTSLHIAIFEDDESILDCLKIIPSSFKKVENLYFEIWIKDRVSNHFKLKMDGVISGLALETCRDLLRKTEVDPEFQKLEVLEQARNAPSILDLKSLTNLTFDVHFKRDSQPLWSHVAQFYAFQPMVKRQGLQVKVRGSQKKTFPLKENDLGPI